MLSKVKGCAYINKTRDAATGKNNDERRRSLLLAGALEGVFGFSWEIKIYYSRTHTRTYFLLYGTFEALFSLRNMLKCIIKLQKLRKNTIS